MLLRPRPGRLCEVEGIGDKRIGMIKKAWMTRRRYVTLWSSFKGTASVPPMQLKFIRNMQKSLLPVVQQNPYKLATDISVLVHYS